MRESLSNTRCSGVIGVPISFWDTYCPKQFEIVGATESEGKGCFAGLRDESSAIAQPVVTEKKNTNGSLFDISCSQPTLINYIAFVLFLLYRSNGGLYENCNVTNASSRDVQTRCGCSYNGKIRLKLFKTILFIQKKTGRHWNIQNSRWRQDCNHSMN